jgi:pyrroloquinoline-quinone synthase
MSNFGDRLDAIRDRLDVLQHPFYLRWTRGELAREELTFYAGQYRHAVIALADAANRAGDPRHAEEERAHVALWDGFLDSVDGDAGASPLAETAQCAAAWSDSSRDRTATLAALYAIEAAQPAISETKRAGLVEHYGATPGSDATRYFDVHAVLDHAHAAHNRRELEGAMQPGDEERVLSEAERVLEANWRLLDGVDRPGRGA